MKLIKCMLGLSSSFSVCKVDFYYVAPELEYNHNDANADDDYYVDGTILGSTEDDLLLLSTRIEIPNSIASIDIILAKDLFIQTQNIERAVRTLKQVIIPQKTVRFVLETSDSCSDSPIGKAKSPRHAIQFNPYTGNSRRSDRIAVRRRSMFSLNS